MPEDTKKKSHQNKGKAKFEDDPKDQRKPKQGRQHKKETSTSEKKTDKKMHGKTSEEPVKTQAEEPGPEFYMNLKRETDDILKISEESNSKYGSKEIKSNWDKYEIPLQSYDEIEEHNEADYEKLIQSSMSAGGHFQFKHEKAWDTATTQSEYDKYFDIYNKNLGVAINTIPFYERNCLDKSLFTETDIFTMNDRATKYKQKYYNDKSYTTAEFKLSWRSVRILESEVNSNKNCDVNELVPEIQRVEINNEMETKLIEIPVTESSSNKDIVPEIDDILDIKINETKQLQSKVRQSNIEIKLQEQVTKVSNPETTVVQNVTNPAAESPEDLEKWLDDFLDN